MDYDYIDEMADDVIRGDYGNGEERKRRLGRRYNAVQNRVNEKLGYDKRYPKIIELFLVLVMDMKLNTCK